VSELEAKLRGVLTGALGADTTVDNLRASNPFLNDGPLKAGDVLTIPR